MAYVILAYLYMAYLLMAYLVMAYVIMAKKREPRHQESLPGPLHLLVQRLVMN